MGQFGLTNAVFAVGDTFVEVVAPARITAVTIAGLAGGGPWMIGGIGP